MEEIYEVGEVLQNWRLCFIPLLNPDGYEIYTGDFQAIRNPIYRQMLRMQEIPSQEYTGNSRGVDLRKNFPTQYYQRKQVMQQPASENETKALIRIFQEYPSCGLLSFDHFRNRILYFKQSKSFAANQKSYRLARHLQKAAVTTWRIPKMARGIFLLQAVREPVAGTVLAEIAISRHFGSKPWKQKERPEKSSCKANIERSIPFRLSICFHCRYSACTYQKFFVQYIIVSILTMKEYFIRSD